MSMMVTSARRTRLATPIGDFLIKAAEVRGFSATDLAKFMGFGKTSICRLINGETADVRGIDVAMMKTLGLSADEALDLVSRSKKMFFDLQSKQDAETVDEHQYTIQHQELGNLSAFLAALSLTMRSASLAINSGLDGIDDLTGLSIAESIRVNLDMAKERFSYLSDVSLDDSPIQEVLDGNN